MQLVEKQLRVCGAVQLGLGLERGRLSHVHCLAGARSAKWQYALLLLAQLEKTQLRSDAVACSSCINAP